MIMQVQQRVPPWVWDWFSLSSPSVLAFYIFYCFCAKRICEKCGVNPGILIWIPIVNLVPLLQAAKMPVWMITSFFHPDCRLLFAS